MLTVPDHTTDRMQSIAYEACGCVYKWRCAHIRMEGREALIWWQAVVGHPKYVRSKSFADYIYPIQEKQCV